MWWRGKRSEVDVVGNGGLAVKEWVVVGREAETWWNWGSGGRWESSSCSSSTVGLGGGVGHLFSGLKSGDNERSTSGAGRLGSSPAWKALMIREA